MKLAGKVALVTGGARIGQSVAEELALKGCDVALTYRTSRPAALAATARVESLGVKGRAIRCDLGSASGARRAVQETVRAFGRLDILVSMASIYERTPLPTLTAAQWKRIIDANLVSAHAVAQAAAPHLRKTRGRIVNIADWVAASGRPAYKGFIPYYTAKKGLIGLTEALALELAPRVLVNAVAPGPIVPPTSITTAEVRDVARVTPLARWGGALEVAKAVIFLCETEFVTGECIRVDGGRHLL